MLRSKIFQFVREQLPVGVDLQSILDRPDVNCDVLDRHGHTVPQDVIQSLFPGVIERKIRRDHPYVSPERAKSIGVKVGMSSLDPKSQKDHIFIAIRNSLSSDLIPALQFQRSGFLSFYPDHEIQNSIISEPQGGGYNTNFLDEGPFEILLDLPKLCSDFRRTRKAVLRLTDMDRTDLTDANLAVRFHRFSRDGSPYLLMNMSIFTPKGGEVTEKGMYLVMDEERIGSGDIPGAIRKGMSALGEEPECGMESLVSSCQGFVATMLNAAHLVHEPELARGKRINPYQVMLNRVRNRNLPQKQKERAKAFLEHLHDMDVTPVSQSKETLPSVNDLAEIMSRKSVTPEWKAETVYEEKLLIEDSPRLRNPHGQLHPQKMMRDLPWIGVRSVSELTQYLDNAPDPIEEDLSSMGDRDPTDLREVALDNFALDMSGHGHEALQCLTQLYSSKLLSIPRDERPISVQPLQIVLDLHRFIGSYKDSGSQCFILNGEVSRLMCQTEISDIDMCDLRLPYDHMYLAFETPVEMQLDGKDNHFVGAYLSGSKRQIDILMIFEPAEPTGSFFQDLQPPLKISLPRSPGMSLQDSIIHALETGGYDLEPGVEEEIPQETMEAAMEAGIKIVKLGPTAQTCIAERNERLFGSMVDGVTIVANTIMAMTAGPDELEVTQTWFSPPKDIRTRLEKGMDLNVKGSGEQIENCMPVRVISLTQEARKRHQADTDAVRKSPEEAYWRKGHWKRQPCGPRNSLRKRIWIEPKLCNEKAELRRSGTVYHASSEELSL